MLTLAAFILGLGLLIAVHELGHYGMAVACRVKVLRFSLGFGRVVWRWQSRRSPTEFVVCAFPLGGYVRMLDEREAPVSADELHQAFNRKPLAARALIVLAGPLANLTLAAFLYAVVQWSGVLLPAPVLSHPPSGSLAAQVGLQGQDRVLDAAFEAESLEPVHSFDGLRWWLMRATLSGVDLHLRVEDAHGAQHPVRLPLSQLGAQEMDEALWQRIGIVAPGSRAVIGEVMPGGAAQRGGLQSGDLVLRIGATRVVDAAHLRALIREAAQPWQLREQAWEIMRSGQSMILTLSPDLQVQGEQVVGRISAFVGEAPELTLLQPGFWGGLSRAWVQTGEVSVLTVQMMVRMVAGQASLSHLSGPITIADYAGRSASRGWRPYMVFLAMISVSLGVLNLLPLPMLDGGHLMYYLWEGLTGRAISDLWLERLQRGGFLVLAFMMSIALFNDFVRLLG